MQINAYILESKPAYRSEESEANFDALTVKSVKICFHKELGIKTKMPN